MRRWQGLAAVMMMTVALAGCVQSEQVGGALASPEQRTISFAVVDDATGQAVFLARIALLSEGSPALVLSTGRNGTASATIGAAVAEFVVDASQHAPYRGSLPTVSSQVEVRLAPKSAQVDTFSNVPTLSFRPAVDLGSMQYRAAVGTSCQDAIEDRDGDCGLGEPSVEVDGLGQVYVSGVCCIGNAPPVYVSRDDGATFSRLETPAGVREAFGVEGDFAIDQNGVVYFADIEVAGTFQVTAWDVDGNFVRHAKWPAPPLVDRDWIRAEGDGGLYYVYNTGGATNVYASSDGGATWSPGPVFTASYGLGNAIKGLAEGELWLVGGSSGGFRLLDATFDGGATWIQEISTAPSGGSFPTGYFDEAGNLYVSSTNGERVTVARRDADGKWNEAVEVSPEGGHHRMAWLAAGGHGKVAVAWYGTLDDSIGPDTQWYVFVAATLDADEVHSTWQVAIADPEPVFVGPLGRDLLDFLQVDIGPDGAIHVAYSKVRQATGNEEQLHYVHSEPTLPLAPDVFFWGPVA